MEYILREEYLNFLHRWRDKSVIKVVSGVRRSGKSTLLAMYKEQLKSINISDEQIIAINFEDLHFYELRDFQKLHQYIKDKAFANSKKYYIFLDEIQHVLSFEEAIDSLQLRQNLDIYITGSNAFFMSGELATLLSGRYVELKILPLSFKEFIAYRKKIDRKLKANIAYYNEYLKSSFPYAVSLTDEERLEYLQGLYATVVVKDIANRLGAVDTPTLEMIIEYLYGEIGSFINFKTISDFLRNDKNDLVCTQPVKSAPKTIERYVTKIEESLLLYRASRYSIKGKKFLAQNFKYYAVDIGLRRLIAGYRTQDYGHILENIVYLELLRRGFSVYVGLVDNLEVDFLAMKQNGERQYIQVAFKTENSKTLQRELLPLQKISDNYPKLLLTLDDIDSYANYEGIEKKSTLDWLRE
ncbi:MAG: ATP-binding protein [Lactobacillales bacterium]|jgi:predicted AAA+ superfamily ATPase|nr:ATP-binding protein [Lactobacillales bacterium]